MEDGQTIAKKTLRAVLTAESIQEGGEREKTGRSIKSERKRRENEKRTREKKHQQGSLSTLLRGSHVAGILCSEDQTEKES